MSEHSNSARESIKERLLKAVRWSEKYARVDMLYLLKGNFWLNVNRVLSIANGLALSIAFAHLLTKEEYGMYAYVLAVIGLFSMPVNTALGAGMFKGVSRGHDYLIFEGLRVILPWSIGGGLLLASAGLYYLVAGNVLLAMSFITGGLLLPISVSVGSAKAFLNSKGNFPLITKLNLWRTPAMTLLMIIAAGLTSSALAVIIVNLIGSVFFGFLFYRTVSKVYNLKSATQGEERFASRYGLHGAILSIFSYLSEQLDDILLWKFVGAAPVAIYTYAISPVRELRSLIENQSAIAAPRFARKEFSEVKAVLPLRIRQAYLLVVPLIVLYILAAPLIFKILFPQYLDAVFLSQIASLSLLSAPRKLFNAAISAHQKIKESYVVAILPNMVRITLAVVLVPTWGIEGAVSALLISEIIDYAVLGVIIRLAK